MGKVENLALHVLNNAKNEVQNQLTIVLQAIDSHTKALESYTKNEVTVRQELQELNNAIIKISGDTNVKPTSKSKKA